MSTSSTSDSYSAPTLIPSPQELSNLITDLYTNEQVDRKFRNKPTSSAILRYYTFISHSITKLKGELERHQQEREILYDNLFTSRTFKYKICPIVEEYQHCRAMRRRSHHPYGCRASPSTPSTNSSPSSEEFPPFQAPSPKKEQTTTPSPINSSSHEQICYDILSFFVSPNISSRYAVSSSVGLIHASSIVSPYVLPFVLHIVLSLFYYRFIHRFDYLYV